PLYVTSYHRDLTSFPTRRSSDLTTVSAEDIQMRGFQSVADVLQQSSFSTGGIQGGQTSASFTQGAEAAGMFSLDPGYTKYLINRSEEHTSELQSRENLVCRLLLE